MPVIFCSTIKLRFKGVTHTGEEIINRIRFLRKQEVSPEHREDSSPTVTSGMCPLLMCKDTFLGWVVEGSGGSHLISFLANTVSSYSPFWSSFLPVYFLHSLSRDEALCSLLCASNHFCFSLALE